MSDATITTKPPTASPTLPVRLPPTPRVPDIPAGPRLLAVAGSGRSPRSGAATATSSPMRTPVFGRTVIVADPGLAKQVFMADTDDVGNIQPNLSRVLGPGSVFALDGTDHRRRRKLLTPPLHGKSIKNYERIFEEETLRETANWPEDQAFGTLEPMMRITLNAILRAVFGADGTHLDELRRIIPPWVTLGSRLCLLPMPSRTYGRYQPVGPVGGLPTAVRRD